MSRSTRLWAVGLWVLVALLTHNAFDAPRPDRGRAEALMALHAALFDDMPRPTGSAEAARARARIADALDAAGCPPRVDEGWSCGPRTCARVSNLWCRMGPEAGSTVVGMAHTDSVPAGPGAADDGAGIVAWVDAITRLDPAALSRSVALVFTDAEEPGLLGARRFFDDPPFEVGEVVNLEARGSGGASVLFETVGPDRPWGRWYAGLGVSPRANSVYPAIYDRMPNGTDLSAVAGGGHAGVNHAFLGGMAHYHTPLDDLAHLDPASLAQQADLASAWIALLQDPPEGRPTVFVDVLGLVLLQWPLWLAWPATVGLALAWIGLLGWDLRCGEVSARSVAAAFGAVGAGWITAAAAAEVVGLGIPRFAGPVWWGHPEGIAGIGFGVVAAVLIWIGGVAPPRARWHAVVGLVAGLGVVLAGVDPRFSTVTIPATTLALLGRGIGWRWPDAGMAILAPALAMAAMPLAVGLGLALTVEHLAVVAVPLGLALLGLAPTFPRAPRWPAAGIALATACAMGIAAVSQPFTADRPQPTRVVDTQSHAGLERWGRAYVGTLPGGSAQRTVSRPPRGLAAPRVSWEAGDRLHVAPARNGTTFVVDSDTPFTLEGVAVPSHRQVALMGAPPDGITLVFSSPPSRLRIAERTFGVPDRTTLTGNGPAVPAHFGDTVDVWIDALRDGSGPPG